MNSATQTLTTWFQGFTSFLPSLVGGLIILVVGYIVALVLRRITGALLSRTKYDQMLSRLGVIDKDRVETHAGSVWTGKAVFWVVMIVTAAQTARAWNLQWVSIGLARVLAYIPHLVGAAVIFAAALYFGNWIRDRIQRREVAREGATQRPMVGSSVRAAVLALGGFMALRELQIAPEIVTIAFTVTIAAIGLAVALAFGMGSRTVAGHVAQEWYERRPAWNGTKREGVTASHDGPRPTP